MIRLAYDGNKSPSRAIVLAVGAWLLSWSSAMGDDVRNPAPAPTPVRKGEKWSKFFHTQRASTPGSPGPAAPGLPAGFQGFGLGYHPGHGYGGAALGVGPEGGYPSYGGPGYPHPSPGLNRLGPIAPFCYFGGPGHPTPDQPHFFEGVGPLARDEPFITFEGDSPDAGYGDFTGAIPYPESTFAPSSTSTGGGPFKRADPAPIARSGRRE